MVVFEKLFEKYRKEILHARLLIVEGRLQREKEVVYVIVSKCIDPTKLLGKLVQREHHELTLLALSPSDEKNVPYPTQHKKAQVRREVPQDVFNGGRNFK